MKDLRKENYENIIQKLKNDEKKNSFYIALKKAFYAFKNVIKIYRAEKNRKKNTIKFYKKAIKPMLLQEYQREQDDILLIRYKEILSSINVKYLNENERFRTYVNKYVFTEDYEKLFNYLNTKEAFAQFKNYCNKPFNNDFKILSENESDVKQLEFKRKFEEFINIVNKLSDYGIRDDYSRFINDSEK